MLIDFLTRDVAVVDHVIILNLHDPAINADQASPFANEHVLLDCIVQYDDVRERQRACELDE